VVKRFVALAAFASANGLAAQTDTIIQPGHIDFSRYDTPSLCVAAVRSQAAVDARTQPDTAAYAPDTDSLPPRAAAVARACGKQFTPAGVAERELLNLTRLALLRGDAAVARSAADRWLAMVRGPAARGRALLALVDAYLTNRPMHRHEAEVLTARLDSLGPLAALSRDEAHGALWLDASLRFDVPRLTEHGVASLALDGHVPDIEKHDLTQGSGNIVYGLIDAEAYRSPATTIERVMQFARQANYKFQGTPEEISGIIGGWISPIGQPVPPLPLPFWFGPHADSSWAIPGKVSLVLVESPENFSYSHDFGLLHRLRARYGDALNITLVCKTKGYVRSSPPLEPAQEADSISNYFRKYLGLPVTVGVEQTPFERLPDGRRVDGPAPTDAQGGRYGFGSVAADREGKGILMYGGADEAMLYAFLDRVIPRSASR